MHPESLLHARCAHPFALLGWQKANKGFCVRVFLPDALSVSVKSLSTGKELGQMTATAVAGIFELVLPLKKKTELYQLHVQMPHYSYQVIDPYQFKEEAFHAVHFVQMRPENLYQQLVIAKHGLAIDRCCDQTLKTHAMDIVPHEKRADLLCAATCDLERL